MKIAIINTVIEGASTGKIATGFYNKLIENGHECRIFYGYGSKSENPDFICIANILDIKLSWLHNQLSGIHGHFSPFSMRRLIAELEEFKPDIVQLYNLHFYYLDIYRLFSYLKLKQIPTVYSMLDEYPYLGYCCYAFDCEQFKTGCKQCDFRQFRKKYPRNLFRNGATRTIALKRQAYADFPKLAFVGPKWVLERARESFLLKGKMLVEVDEFVDTENVFYPRESKRIRERLQIDNKKTVILNVAPSKDPRKGFPFFLELARKMEKDERFQFVHVGFQGDLNDLPTNMIGISYVSDQNELAEYYSMADVFVCTSVADTMPNVCLDALACGTPVIGFKITGIPYIGEKPLARFVDVRNVSELEVLVRTVLRKTPQVSSACRHYAEQRYSPDTYYRAMKKIYTELL